MMPKTNKNLLIEMSVMGNVSQPNFPGLPSEPYKLDSNGSPFLLPTWGSITHNISVGDSAFGWEADCIHPGVSIKYENDNGNRGLNILSCIGNEAIIFSGEAKNSKGVVTGKSGRFSEQVIIHFPKKIREKIAINDKILIKSLGVGLKINNFKNIHCKSLSPKLFEEMNIKIKNNKLLIPIKNSIPSHLVGAGAGLTSESGSIHIQTSDKNEVEKYNLKKLKLGDIVLIENYDSRYQHGYLQNSCGIAVIGQTDSPRSGYGPGMTLLMTGTYKEIQTKLYLEANIKKYLNLKE